MPPGRMLPLALWVTALVAVLTTVTLLGAVLPGPPLTDPGSWGPWLDAAPVAVGLAAARLAVLAIVSYLLAATALGAGARLLSATALVRVLDAMTVPRVRALLRATCPPPAVGLGMAVQGVVGGDGASMVRPGGPVAAHAAGSPQRVAWEVRGGEHFRSIAEAALHEVLGRRPTEAELAPYYRELVDENRGVLADPEDPNLLFPGQVLVIPPVSRSAPSSS